jgi:hypothetical protein
MEALISGVTDPNELAELVRGRLRSKIPALREALANHFDLHHGVIVRSGLDHLDQLDAAILAVSIRINEAMAPYRSATELLCTIPGVSIRTAECLVAEIGADMNVFPRSRRGGVRLRFTVLHGGREVSDALRDELADELEERAARSRAVELDELCRLAAQDLLAVALEAERRAYLEARRPARRHGATAGGRQRPRPDPRGRHRGRCGGGQRPAGR